MGETTVWRPLGLGITKAYPEPQGKEGTVDTDRIEGKTKEYEGKGQQKWADVKDTAEDKLEDVKDKAEDVVDSAEDRWDERGEKDPAKSSSA
jgi:uncharacterized protein YjbJ (UPF0337 family)